MPLLRSKAQNSRRRHRLPPLSELLASVDLMQSESRKVTSTMEIIREVAISLRSYESVSFYSMREFQDVLGVALRTVSIAFERLEAEGLLVRLRGSHTRLKGTQAQPMSPIRGVVGWMENLHTLRHYQWRRTFSRAAGDAIRKSHFVTDTILHWSGEERDLDFAHRVLSRKPDIAVWFQPTPLHQQTFEILRENGIRNLKICDKGRGRGEIEIDWTPAYSKLLAEWQTRHAISQIVLVADPAQGVIGKQLETMALERGMSVRRLPYGPELPRIAAQQLPEGQGILFLDEWSAAEFCQHASFLELSNRYRILFARDLPNISFAQPDEYQVDRLCYPVPSLVTAIREILLHWEAGEEAHFIVKGEIQMGGATVPKLSTFEMERFSAIG